MSDEDFGKLMDTTHKLAEQVGIEFVELCFFKEVKNFMEFIENHNEITQYDDFTPDSHINIQTSIRYEDRVFYAVIQSYIDERGAFRYEHSEVYDVDYFPEDLANPDPDKFNEEFKEFLREDWREIAEIILFIISVALAMTK